jgi:biotin carboxylase
LSATNPQLYARLERQKEKEENARRLSALTVAGASPQDIERFREEAQAIQELNSREVGLPGGSNGPTHAADDEDMEEDKA